MSDSELSWVILTQGDRPDALRSAVRSIRESAGTDEVEIVVVLNGCVLESPLDGVRVVELLRNEGVPGGRQAGAMAATGSIVAFLDDDAELRTAGAPARIRQEFDDDPDLGAVSFRLVDESGESARRHVPRIGSAGADRSGDVTTFLGGASAVRRNAYVDAGGYWPDLFYGHEELDLSWRLIDRGYRVAYLSGVVVFHPRTEISRHGDGWRMTGRNRVWIARRNLPWPLAIVHTMVWLVAGTWRAGSAACRSAYVTGWWSGWRDRIEHRPIRWLTVWHLTRRGRPPLI